MYTRGSVVKNLPARQETWVWSLHQKDPLAKEIATHPSILAWEIPWTEDNPKNYCCDVCQSVLIMFSPGNSMVCSLTFRNFVFLKYTFSAMYSMMYISPSMTLVAFQRFWYVVFKFFWLKIISFRASNLDWQLVSYMIFYMFQCHSPKSSHPLPLPQSP